MRNHPSPLPPRHQGEGEPLAFIVADGDQATIYFASREAQNEVTKDVWNMKPGRQKTIMLNVLATAKRVIGHYNL
jgi:hypothetical protein